MDRERVSLSLKATQEDPWRQFARTHAIGQIVPGKVTKLVPFGAFVRVEEGIEGLVHISELAERHVDVPDQVVAFRSHGRLSTRLERRQSSVPGNDMIHKSSILPTACLTPTTRGKTLPWFDPETNEWLEARDAA